MYIKNSHHTLHKYQSKWINSPSKTQRVIVNYIIRIRYIQSHNHELDVQKSINLFYIETLTEKYYSRLVLNY